MRANPNNMQTTKVLLFHLESSHLYRLFCMDYLVFVKLRMQMFCICMIYFWNVSGLYHLGVLFIDSQDLLAGNKKNGIKSDCKHKNVDCSQCVKKH